MRVIAGSLGGRRLQSLEGKTAHPMSERIRGALFNSLGDLTELEVLDAFGGTGAVALEAYSRGAACVTVVEKDHRVFRTLKENLTSLGVENEISASRANVASWVQRQQDRTFDVIICDPPFEHRQDETLLQLATRLKPEGLFIVLQSKSLELIDFTQLELIKDSEYSDARLLIYKRPA